MKIEILAGWMSFPPPIKKKVYKVEMKMKVRMKCNDNESENEMSW